MFLRNAAVRGVRLKLFKLGREVRERIRFLSFLSMKEKSRTACARIKNRTRPVFDVSAERRLGSLEAAPA